MEKPLKHQRRLGLPFTKYYINTLEMVQCRAARYTPYRYTAFSRSAHPTNKAKAKNAWFDNNCAEASNNFKQVRNQFLRNKSDTNRRNFVSMRTRYNRIKKIAKKKQKQKEGREVSALAKKTTQKILENHQEKNLRKKHNSLKK